VIADIAVVFHWPLSEFNDMSVQELLHWQDLAIERYNAMHKKAKP